MQFVILAIFGTICAVVAHSKGRNPIGWFFIGFFFTLLGLILILVVSNPKKAKAVEEHMEMEQRRLREQLRQEQLKTEQLRKYAQARLDIHDRELNIDTRHAEPLMEQSQLQPTLDQGSGFSTPAVPVQPLGAGAKAGEGEIETHCPRCHHEFAIPRQYDGREVKCLNCNERFVAAQFVQSSAAQGPSEGWHYQYDGAAYGPVSMDTLKQMVRDGRIDARTFIWHSSLANWTPAGKVGYLNMELDGA